MLDDYLMIHKSILPDYYDKVLEARRLLEDGKEKEVSQAVKAVGISRSTYYKYKDFILDSADVSGGRKAIISMLLTHEPGVLSSVLNHISAVNGSVLTITQNLPIHDRARVTITLDLATMNVSVNQLLESLAATVGVEKPKLEAVE